MGNSSTVRLMVELFPIFYTSNQNLTFRKIGNSSTISLTVELFPIYAFELFPIYAIRTIYAFTLRTRFCQTAVLDGQIYIYINIQGNGCLIL